MTLTKQQIINRMECALARMETANTPQDNDYDLQTSELCRLALERLELEPRPIVDSDMFEGPCLLYCSEPTWNTWPGINRVVRRVTADGIVCFQFDNVPTLKTPGEVGASGYIPLSALPSISKGDT
jgi:hypothetical protein